MTEVDKDCPDYSLGSEGQSATDLIDKLKEAMPKDKEEKEALTVLLTARKSTPADLEQAYMDVPLIVAYYAQVRDGIDGSEFSAFGSLYTNKCLLDEIKVCAKDLDKTVRNEISYLYENKYPAKKQDLVDKKNLATEESERLLSCLEIADIELARRKSEFCGIAGSKLEYTKRDEAGNDTVEDKELEYCKKEAAVAAEAQSKLPPQGAAAQVEWLSKELVRKFKALGVTDERGKKSSVPCDSLSVPLEVVYARAVDIEHDIKELSKAEQKKNPQFKKDLDTAWKDWITATYKYIQQYMVAKEKSDALAGAKGELTAFKENWENKYLRDAQDVEVGDDESCDRD